MSRAGRGGRGGRGGPDMNVSNRLMPFDVDPELAEAAENGGEDSENDSTNGLFPDLDEYIMSAPITDEERKGVQIERDIQAKRRAGPFWTGSKEQWAEIDGKKEGNFNAFEDAPTYGNKRKKKGFQLVDMKKVKAVYPEFLPKEIRDVVEDDSEDDEQPAKKRKLGLASKSAVDKLAKFDEGAEEDATAEEYESSEDDDASEIDDEDDEFDREPADSDTYDDEEEDDDYNAERYFDGGDDGLDEGGYDEDEEGDDDEEKEYNPRLKRYYKADLRRNYGSW